METTKQKIIRRDMEEIYASRSDWERLRGKRIYVTGAAGMIASYLVMFLMYLNEAYGFETEIYAGIRNLQKAQNRFGDYINRKYFHLVSRDVSLPCEIEEPLDYIVHAASLASPQYYGKYPVETMLPNVIGTQALLQYAVEKPLEGFVFLSSGNVYGTVSGVEEITENVIGTFDFTGDGNVYGESKRCGEALCRAYAREYGVPARSVRVHHTYGPVMDIRGDSRVFAEFVKNVVDGEDIVMKSDGSARRAFCYLTDTVSGILTVLLDGCNGNSYNIGNPQEYMSIRELALLLQKLSGSETMKVSFAERKTEGYLATSEKREAVLSVAALEALGWQPRVSAGEGFGRCIRYHKSE